MILLLTCDGDLSCDLVIEWLNHYGHPFSRLNSFELITEKLIISLSNNGNYQIDIGGNKLNMDDINAVWFRKFGFFVESELYLEASKHVDNESLDHLTKEFNKLLGTIVYLLKNKKWLTNPFKKNLNKFNTLLQANECGLDIPDSYITNYKRKLSEIEKKGDCITKSLYDPIITSWKNDKFMMYTTTINKEDIIDLPELFLPSLVQSQIIKEYEIRVFYLANKCYSMAIYSQDDEQTRVDFRKYNWEKPNRYIPYKLPMEIEKKLKLLMKKLDLNCASIDFIKGKDDKYYFLEINPTGQFGMVDFPCNYGLHKKVAETLIKMDN